MEWGDLVATERKKSSWVFDRETFRVKTEGGRLERVNQDHREAGKIEQALIPCKEKGAKFQEKSR